MKNPWKTCYPFFLVHRVHGIQNDQRNLAGKNWKICSVVRVINKTNEENDQRSANISGYSTLFCNFFQHEWLPVILKTCNIFFMDFSSGYLRRLLGLEWDYLMSTKDFWQIKLGLCAIQWWGMHHREHYGHGMSLFLIGSFIVSLFGKTQFTENSS